MNKYERAYEFAERQGKASWMQTAIMALAFDIEDALAETVEVSGPFGLRAEVIIATKTKLLILTPDFSDGFRLNYDTGESIERFKPGTIGYINQMNNVTAPLPDTLDEILQIMTERVEARHEHESNT